MHESATEKKTEGQRENTSGSSSKTDWIIDSGRKSRRLAYGRRLRQYSGWGERERGPTPFHHTP